MVAGAKAENLQRTNGYCRKLILTMADFITETYTIIDILKKNNEEDGANKFSNALLVGGTPGEKFSIVVCLLKTYQITNLTLFNLVKEPALQLYREAEHLKYNIRSNFDIFELLH